MKEVESDPPDDAWMTVDMYMVFVHSPASVAIRRYLSMAYDNLGMIGILYTR